MSYVVRVKKLFAMHELSIVINILDTAEENAKNNNASIVNEIELEIGELSGVEYDALNFAFENAPKNEMLKNVVFVIQKIKGKAICNGCKQEFELSDYYTPCPVCNKFESDIIQGKELKIKSINID